MSVDNKTALITGSSRGIERAIAERFAAEDWITKMKITVGPVLRAAI